MYDSYQALATGNFHATDLLGFAPSVGWAMGAARGARGFSRGIASAQYSIGRAQYAALEEVSEEWLSHFGHAVAGNSRLARLYRRVNDAGIDVTVDFRPTARTAGGTVTRGVFDPVVTRSSSPSITLFARAVPNADGLAHVFAHEARHALDHMNGLAGGSRWSEYRAFVEEFISENGRSPVRTEMGRLARRVESRYAHLQPHRDDLRLRRVTKY